MTTDEMVVRVEALLRRHPDQGDLSGAKPADLIERAEAHLGITFPPSYREFLRRWGAMGFGPEEIYGITSAEFENDRVPNGIWFTAKKRDQGGLPSPLLVVVNDNGDVYYCIDTARTDDQGESPIVSWDTHSRSVVGNKSSSFGEFLVKRLEEAAELIEEG